MDIAPNSDVLFILKKFMIKKQVDAIDYLFRIAGTVHGLQAQSLKHDHYLYVKYQSDA